MFEKGAEVTWKELGLGTAQLIHKYGTGPFRVKDVITLPKKPYHIPVEEMQGVIIENPRTHTIPGGKHTIWNACWLVGTRTRRELTP